MRIFSSAEYCLWVARRMSLIICSVGAFPAPDFCLIFAPLKGYDEPEILRSQLSRFGPISADAGQSTAMVSREIPGSAGNRLISPASMTDHAGEPKPSIDADSVVSMPSPIR